LEVYRRNLYSLRRLILTGTSQQRNRVMHMFTQQWVDQLVASLINAQAGPRAWISETLDVATACSLLPQQGLSVSSSSSGSSSPLNQQQQQHAQQQQQQQQKISPLAALMWHIQQLVNPDELVNKMQVEFKTVRDGIAYDTTAQALLQLHQQAAGAELHSSDSSDQTNQQQQQRVASVPLNVSEIQVLTQQQLQELAAYLVQDQQLPWPTPRFQVGFNLHLALAAHATLFGTPAAAAYSSLSSGQPRPAGSSGSSKDSSSSSSSSSSGAAFSGEQLQLPEDLSVVGGGVLASQRPAITGRHATKVRMQPGVAKIPVSAIALCSGGSQDAS
jgi:hypothetical protein